ncbi:hypothetical protein HID58_037505 [Brassica napus]|uniref:Protein kinase domain-containing protein n=1 Tax=Brassica napus TaxID=3708 RepID=A0ABQ8BMV8_BRANA|nr:hypothetical protein HID58_037505 [Brassica napus]
MLSLFLSYVSIEIILSEKQTQTFIPMEPTGNSADSSDRKTGKKIVASSATVKPNGKSIASSAIVKTDVSSTVPVKPNVATALSSTHADQVMLFRDVSFGPREAELRFRLIHFWEARNPLTNGRVEQKVTVATNINPKLVGELVTTRLVSVGRYCNEDSKMIDVYEYREKGTLKDHRNDSDNPRLSWRQKLEICAKGLHYLHTGSARATIHFAIEALDPNHKLGTGTTRSKINLNRKTTSYHQTVPSLFLSYVSIEIILSEKQTQTFIPMEPTGNSADSSDRKTGKKIIASSATVKPNGKSIASSAIVKTDVSSTVPVKPNVATALSSTHADQVMLFRDVSFGPREAELRFRLIHFWEARNPLTNGRTLRFEKPAKGALLHCTLYAFNIVIGYCNEDSKMIDVYEYREKGTLKDHRNDSDNPRLSWRQKLEICAKGLHYLHTGSARATIHFAIEALDPNHKLGTGTTRSKINLNRKTTSYHQTVP